MILSCSHNRELHNQKIARSWKNTLFLNGLTDLLCVKTQRQIYSMLAATGA